MVSLTKRIKVGINGIMETNVAFINKKLKGQFDSLKSGKSEDQKLYKFIDRALDDSKTDITCGVKVPKKLWPKSYVQEYGLTNLWKYNLPDAWRLIYTI